MASSLNTEEVGKLHPLGFLQFLAFLGNVFSSDAWTIREILENLQQALPKSEISNYSSDLKDKFAVGCHLPGVSYPISQHRWSRTKRSVRLLH